MTGPSPRDPLLDEIARVAREVPAETLHELARLLEADGIDDPAGRATPAAAAQSAIRRLLDVWKAAPNYPSADALAWAIRAACTADRRVRAEERVELVWTGPTPPGSKLRRIDQALLELIRKAKDRLLIVTFAAYKIPELQDALIDATRRGVEITFLLETLEDSKGKVTFDPALALGAALARTATILHWPLDRRPRDAKGNHGRLHAKFAVADGRRLLISSANLTEFAMKTNLECGLLVNGTQRAHALEAHVSQLLSAGVFRRDDRGRAGSGAG